MARPYAARTIMTLVAETLCMSDELGANADPTTAEARYAALLLAARAGDVEAFEAFYSATVRQMIPPVRRICGDNHADDVLAEAYFQAWNTLDAFDPKRGTAVQWLRIIACSRARDWMRRERLRHGGSGSPPPFDADLEPSPAAGPQELTDRRQTHAALRLAIRALPSSHRWMVGLAYYKDCTHADIARITGLPLGTVKSMIRQSHSRLKRLLDVARPLSSAP